MLFPTLEDAQSSRPVLFSSFSFLVDVLCLYLIIHRSSTTVVAIQAVEEVSMLPIKQLLTVVFSQQLKAICHFLFFFSVTLQWNFNCSRVYSWIWNTMWVLEATAQ